VRGTGGFPEPTWKSVVERRSGFNPWDDTRVRIDSVRPLEESVGMALEYLGREHHCRQPVQLPAITRTWVALPSDGSGPVGASGRAALMPPAVSTAITLPRGR
jgi:hypothetical protein